MPCRDDGYPIPFSNSEVTKLEKEKQTLEAMLCALATFLEKNDDYIPVIDIDWISSGVTYKEFETWWINHKEKDKKRIEKEKQALEKFMKTNSFNKEYLKKLLED